MRSMVKLTEIYGGAIRMCSMEMDNAWVGGEWLHSQ